MKKFIFTLITLSFVFISNSFSQEIQTPEILNKKPSFWFGPKVGLNLLTPTIDRNQITEQIKSNYQIGFFMQFGRKLYLQPEFYYSYQKENYGNTNNESSVSSVKLPLLLGIKVFDIGLVSTNLKLGPSFSFLIRETVANPERKKNNISFHAGAGIEILGFITLDIRYSIDLNNSFRTQIQQLSWDSGVNATIGLKFR